MAAPGDGDAARAQSEADEQQAACEASPNPCIDFDSDKQCEYYGLTDPYAAAGYLSSQLQLPDYKRDARSAVHVDFCMHVLEKTKSLRLSPKKANAVFRIAQELLQLTKGGKDVHDAEQLLRNALMSLCRARPLEEDHFLSPDQITHVTQIFMDEFFANFRLYSHVFNLEQGHTSYSAMLTVERPVVQPFEKAMPEAEWVERGERLVREAEEQRLQAEQEAQRLLEEQHLAALQQEREEAEAAWAAQQKQKPATLEEAVEHLVAVRLDQERVKLQEQYEAKEQSMQQQVQEMRAKLTVA